MWVKHSRIIMRHIIVWHMWLYATLMCDTMSSDTLSNDTCIVEWYIVLWRMCLTLICVTQLCNIVMCRSYVLDVRHNVVCPMENCPYSLFKHGTLWKLLLPKVGFVFDLTMHLCVYMRICTFVFPEEFENFPYPLFKRGTLWQTWQTLSVVLSQSCEMKDVKLRTKLRTK